MSALTVAVNIVAYDMTRDAISGVSSDLGNLEGAALGAAAAFQMFYGALSGGIGSAGDLQYELTRLNNATELDASAFPKLEQAVVDMADHSMYSTTDMGKAFEKLSEMGFKAQDIMYGFGPASEKLYEGAYNSTAALQGLGRQAAAVGEAMNASAVQGATLLGTALNTFKDQGYSAAQMASFLVGTFYNGIPDITQLQDALNQAGGTADASGVKFQDLATMLDMLAQAGQRGSTAGNSLAYMLRSLDDPTAKQAKDMAYLGIISVNTGSAFQNFSDKLAASGSAGAAAVQGFDGSVTSLQKMYTAAQNVGLVNLDESFNQWAIGSGILSSKLFDAKGNFLGFKNALDVLDAAMGAKGATMQEKMAFMGDLFNVRSGKAAMLLTNLKDFDGEYTNIWNRIGKADALGNAQKMLSTFNGSLTALKTTFGSLISEALLPVADALSHVFVWLNQVLSTIINSAPWVKTFIAAFLIAGTVISGIVVVALIALVAALTPLGPFILAFIAVFAGIVVVAGIVAGVITLVSMHIKQLAEFFHPAIQAVEQFASGLVQRLGPAMGTIRTIISAVLIFLRDLWFVVWGAFGPFIKIALDIVLAAVRFVFDTIKFIIFLVLDVIGGKWGQAWTDIKNFGLEIWNNIKDTAISIWNTLVSVATAVWNHIYQVISVPVHQVQFIITTIFNFVVGFISNALNNIVNIGHAAWNNFVDAIQAAVGLVSGAVHGIVSAITGILGNLAGMAFHWASDMIGGFINGIKSMAGGVIGAVGGVVGGIAGMLHHSTPDTGPLAGDDQWMPDMMLGFARDIENYTPYVLRAASGVATAIHGGINTPANSLISGGAFGSGAAGAGTQTIILEVDGRELTRVVLDRTTGTLKQAGGARQFK